MKTYLLDNESHPLDASIAESLDELGVHYEKLKLPEDHESIPALLEKKDFGVVFLPAMWEDLYSIKVVQEIRAAPGLLEAVIVGAVPGVRELVVAFNEGISAYLETPVKTNRAKQVLSRVGKKLGERVEQLNTTNKLNEYEAGAIPYLFSPQVIERDQMIAAAFMNVINHEYPIVHCEVHVLLVSSSIAQQRRLSSFLDKVGLTVKTVGNMKDAEQLLEKKNFNLIISDNMLPDGDAISLVAKLRKMLKSHMPRVIVWSSSPDKAVSLLKPETYIDDVIIKPGPGASIEYILPSLISNIYQTI